MTVVYSRCRWVVWCLMEPRREAACLHFRLWPLVALQQIGRRPSNTNTSLSGTPAGQGDTAGVVHGAFHEVRNTAVAHRCNICTLQSTPALGFLLPLHTSSGHVLLRTWHASSKHAPQP